MDAVRAAEQFQQGTLGAVGDGGHVYSYERREDFARLMRKQGIAANATPRAIRGENKKYPREKIFKAQRYGTSSALHDRVIGIANELSRSRTIVDPARDRLIETRKSLISAWMKAAEVLDAQGEIILAGDAQDLGTRLKDNAVQLGVFHGFEQQGAQAVRLGQEESGPLVGREAAREADDEACS